MALTRVQILNLQRYLEEEGEKWPEELAEVPRQHWQWMQGGGVPDRVWRSKEFLVQQYPAPSPALCRLSICRAKLNDEGGWVELVSGWDVLQRLKREAGYGDFWAVEVFPAEDAVVSVANMRHLWVLKGEPEFGWRVEG